MGGDEGLLRRLNVWDTLPRKCVTANPIMIGRKEKESELDDHNVESSVELLDKATPRKCGESS
jgi:hypothetical protein